MKQELMRKLIHLSSLVYPILYLSYLSQLNMIRLTLALTCLLVAVDFLRIQYSGFQALCNKVFGLFSRPKEKEGCIYGSTYFMCGICFVTIFFSKYTAIASMFILIISDASASIIGKMVKSKKLVGAKTLSGFLAFVFTATFILILFSQSFSLNTLFLAFFIAIIIGIIELFSKFIRLDDNLLIPIICSFLITFTGYAIIS